jgi:hypothetical protein
MNDIDADLRPLLGAVKLDSNGMLVDEAEYFNEDRPDVAIITPDSSIDEPEGEPLANDCTSLFSNQNSHYPPATFMSNAS